MSWISFILWPAYFISLYLLVFWFIFYLTNKDRIKDEINDTSELKVFPLVSVIVPAYNEENTIIKTLESILNLDYPNEKLEVLVMNDGSKDNTEEVVNNFIKKHKDRDIKLITKPNAGKAVCLNRGMRMLRGEYFACLDADSFVDRNALKRILRIHLKDKDLAIVTPVLRVHKPRNWIQKFQRIEYLASMVVIKLMSYMDTNFIAPGPFSVYKTDIIRKLGGFDEDNLVEDQEIAYKAQKAHYRIRQCSRAFVYTVAPHTLKGLSKQRNRWFKGTLLNLFDYRFMLFNKKYGDFGLFQMPLTLIAFIFAFVAILSLFYHLVKPIFLQLKNLYLVRFDIMTYIRDFHFSFNLLDVDVLSSLLIYTMLLLAVVLLYFSSRMTDDKVRKHGFWYIVPYFFVYFLILSFITIKVVLEVIIGKKQKW